MELAARWEMTFQLLSWLKIFPLWASLVSGDLVTLAQKISTTAYVLFMPWTGFPRWFIQLMLHCYDQRFDLFT